MDRTGGSDWLGNTLYDLKTLHFVIQTKLSRGMEIEMNFTIEAITYTKLQDEDFVSKTQGRVPGHKELKDIYRYRTTDCSGNPTTTLLIELKPKDESESEDTVVLTERSETLMVKNRVVRRRQPIVDDTRFIRTRVRAGKLGSLRYRLGSIAGSDRSTCSRLFHRKSRSPLVSPIRTSSSCERYGI